uniref:Uncharacterized protein n=1 Tax=Mucochytrium quahogii TaxID=96639 RepID=A0A7S2RIS2_9STRA|mmetsp:Transcript_7763/g.12540  ORF Transcript_7763/g.12540 Transcript_7763/m.12540 type:complete len:238 (+) Transcript_7763:133-846(+)
MGVGQFVQESNVIWMFMTVVAGALVGLVLSFLVNTILVEISLDSFPAFYFGFVFLFLGVLMVFRVVRFQGWKKRVLMLTFALMIIASGVLCFVFKASWLFTLSPLAKMPLYGLLGISTCFMMTFTILDVINFCSSCCSPSGVALIESAEQVNLVLIVSVIMGFGYGIFFGLLDVGKKAHTGNQLRRQLVHEEIFCVPFGITLGACAALYNEYLRQRQIKEGEYKYSPLYTDEQDDMI